MLRPLGLCESQYIGIPEFLSIFSPRSAPSLHTARRWLASGKLPGVQFNRVWYIDRIALQSGGNPLLAKILRHGSDA